MEYSIREKKALHRGFFHLDAYTVTHERFGGGEETIVREHLERGDAVAMLLYDPACDQVLLIEQFRIGPAVRNDNPWLIEIVAGMIDAEEEAEAAAMREAEEEAGYRPYAIRHLGKYYSTPGGSSERIELYLGLADSSKPVGDGGGMHHEQEDIRSFWIPRQEAMDWLAGGRINSGAPMLALLLAFGSDGVLADIKAG
ncbi:MAG TPA: NUDIX domain-containing protein [Mariprofundaceae bacterium]|nr:NUDIX domain-containing protein [Mariprofundaceae bacterium]